MKVEDIYAWQDWLDEMYSPSIIEVRERVTEADREKGMMGVWEVKYIIAKEEKE